jgi:hypothetical protein
MLYSCSSTKEYSDITEYGIRHDESNTNILIVTYNPKVLKSNISFKYSLLNYGDRTQYEFNQYFDSHFIISYFPRVLVEDKVQFPQTQTIVYRQLITDIYESSKYDGLIGQNQNLEYEIAYINNITEYNFDLPKDNKDYYITITLVTEYYDSFHPKITPPSFWIGTKLPNGNRGEVSDIILLYNYKTKMLNSAYDDRVNFYDYFVNFFMEQL